MNFDEISKIDDDLKRSEALYNFFDEERRFSSKAGQVEKFVTMHEIEKLVHSESKVLDVGAGTGAYTIAMADMVDEIVAIEPSPKNYGQLVEKIKSNRIKNVVAKNESSFDMDKLESDYFDMVLLFGPLYHLSSPEDRANTLKNAKRVLKCGGHILVSFINHDMLPMSETYYNPNFLALTDYDPKTQRIVDRPFIFFKLDECIKMLEDVGLVIEKKIASDGFSEILENQINEMNETAYENYLQWHLSHCENPELLGATNHFLFVCKAVRND